MGLNVIRISENGRFSYLIYKRKHIIDHITQIRDGVKAGKYDVIYELFDCEMFKLQTLFYGIDIKKRDNVWCPTKVRFQIQNSETKREALIQRLSLILDYLKLYQQQQEDDITSVPSLSKSTRPV